ncbi:CoA ester lyase [Salinibacterium sp. ZJ450]|uniref:HpcH/HpaI aldolase/citrate lyase family protein n=1 Tax=Salinibacterium sp. ZJ450 TaxID=2708338 RepID=UPI00141F1265|nr:CoA ester lyase [Salinibacterium sp. ZJ450]
MSDERWRAPRSLLFVPATKLDLLAKVDRWRPDLVVVDLEDAVHPEDKASARRDLAAALGDGVLADVVSIVVIRVNAPGTPWHVDDLEALGPYIPIIVPGVVVPKAEAIAPLLYVRDRLDRPGAPRAYVLGGIETALGVADSRSLLASELLDAVYFGAEDYISDLGGIRTKEGDEVAVARTLVALHARLAGVPALDQAYLQLADHEGLAAETAQGRALGYIGKICIHPGQVGVVHEAQRPSGEEVEHARRVIDVAAAGVGAVDGVMVDAVHLRMAEQTLRRLEGSQEISAAVRANLDRNYAGLAAGLATSASVAERPHRGRKR